jgi:hypothetical protein
VRLRTRWPFLRLEVTPGRAESARPGPALTPAEAHAPRGAQVGEQSPCGAARVLPAAGEADRPAAGPASRAASVVTSIGIGVYRAAYSTEYGHGHIPESSELRA